MNLDLTQIPFSRYGADLTVGPGRSSQAEPGTAYLRNIHGHTKEARPGVRIALLRDGKELPYEMSATEARFDLTADGGRVHACMPAETVLRFRGEGVTMRMSLPEGGPNLMFPVGGKGRWLVNWRAGRTKLLLTPLRGELHVDSPWDGKYSDKVSWEIAPDADGLWELAIEECLTASPDTKHEADFDACVASVEKEVASFTKGLPRCPDELADARRQAGYLMWSAVVRPHDQLHRPAMLMSKNHMTRVWSWDHCFNAMALAGGHPDLAWDQFILPFDLADERGCPPDAMDDGGRHYNFCKPPIHGWTLHRLMKHKKCVTPARLKRAYQALSRWSDYWRNYRDEDGDGLPVYHHGNDSGWDNATVFAVRPPVKGPDLAAFLAVQMDMLAGVAKTLGKASQADRWKRRSVDLVRRLTDQLWRETNFVAPQAHTGLVSDLGDSLIVYMPLLLGRRLPKAIRKTMLEGLTRKDRFLGEHGPATESLKSAAYEDDGYWRGPIWAPSTMILVEGLRRCGEKELARETARRFCRTCAANGFAENFDAKTGAGLRDKAYTWTASVFLLLANRYLMKG